MTIKLKDIWLIENLREYKIHFGRWNGEQQPLDAWVRDRAEWVKWQETKPGRDVFNREYIFSLMDFYHEQDTWLFGGIFRVLTRHQDSYEVELTGHGASFIGRLKLLSNYRRRATRVNFENHYESFKVREILPESYSGSIFPGYENVHISFTELESLVHKDRSDWKSALENVKGVYQITDLKTGKRYVGAAYGDKGIWSRWSDYVNSGHGNNRSLRELVGVQGISYARDNFCFTLLEYRSFRSEDQIIIDRETFWKDALLTRGKFGLNRN